MSAFRFLALLVLVTLSLAVVACGSAFQDSTSGGAPAAAGSPAAPPTQEPVTSSAAPVGAGASADPSAQEPAISAAALAEVTRPSCDITPRQTEGPYYFDAGQVRRDITESKPGTPLLVKLHLVEAGSCEPIRDACERKTYRYFTVLEPILKA